MKVLAAMVAIAWLALSAPAAAVCEPSGAYDVATHEELPGAIIVWDSSRRLHESTDDGDTWHGTNRLPLESARSSLEVCTDDGCYRIRDDGLGLERQTSGGWSTLWEYRDIDIPFLERQLPGACGEGHSRLGLTALIGAPQSSAHDVLVAAGPDGLWAIGPDGKVHQGVFGSPADPAAPASELYLTPERVGVAVVAVAAATLLVFWTGPDRGQTVLSGLLGLAALPWVVLPQMGARSLYTPLMLTAVFAGVAIWVGRRFRADVAEFLVGALWGGGFTVAVGAVPGAESARLNSYVPAIVGTGLMALSLWASRERAGGIGPLRAAVPIVLWALLALGIFQLWAMRIIEAKVVADALVMTGLPVAVWWGARTTGDRPA